MGTSLDENASSHLSIGRCHYPRAFEDLRHQGESDWLVDHDVDSGLASFMWGRYENNQSYYGLR